VGGWRLGHGWVGARGGLTVLRAPVAGHGSLRAPAAGGVATDGWRLAAQPRRREELGPERTGGERGPGDLRRAPAGGALAAGGRTAVGVGEDRQAATTAVGVGAQPRRGRCKQATIWTRGRI